MSGKLVIFSAPSGSGKTSIVRSLLESDPSLGFSISACTRDKRGRTEVHGKDYYFMTPAEFKRHIDAGDFVEWEEVYEGSFYGTLQSEIERLWDMGKVVLFDVDVKGGLSIKQKFGNDALAIFVKVPNLEVLRQRLKKRSTDSDESISTRLFKAEFEMSFEDKFDAVIVNETLQTAVEESKKAIDRFLKS